MTEPLYLRVLRGDVPLGAEFRWAIAGADRFIVRADLLENGPPTPETLGSICDLSKGRPWWIETVDEDGRGRICVLAAPHSSLNAVMVTVLIETADGTIREVGYLARRVPPRPGEVMPLQVSTTILATEQNKSLLRMAVQHVARVMRMLRLVLDSGPEVAAGVECRSVRVRRGGAEREHKHFVVRDIVLPLLRATAARQPAADAPDAEERRRNRWHEVRGHLRRLRSGRVISVKPHQRGDSERGFVVRGHTEMRA